MVEIIAKRQLREDVFQMGLAVPDLAKKAQAGQFIIIRVDEKGERIPLSLADINPKKGTISIIFMAVGKTTAKLATLEPGDFLADISGPLGNPTHIEKYGRVVLVGGGFGAAPLYPIAKALKKVGNEIISILGARSANLLVYEKELGSVSDRVLISTDDGSKGTKGLVTDVLKNLIENELVDHVIAIGPAIMMKFVSLTTKPFGIKTTVSLNPIMMDGTGMCGACRVSISGKTKFGCIDGPDFDGHEVDWELLMTRQKQYLSEEKLAYEKWLCECKEKEEAKERV
jgi:ferredoxin--NADP+ reductase